MREIVSVKGEQRLKTNEMGAGKAYGEGDCERDRA